MNWINIADLSFKLFELYKIKNKTFSSLELKYMLYAQAKFGGPIAITSAPEEYIMGSEANSIAIKNICIFKNDGTLMHKISKEGMARIVGMDFIDEEYLIVVMQEGSYMLIDPHKGVTKTYNLGSRFTAEYILEAKIVDNAVVFYTNFQNGFRFYFLKNIFAPQCEDFGHGDFKHKPAFFLPLSSVSTVSKKLECLVTNHTAGIHRLIEGQDEMIMFNSKYAHSHFLANLPHINDIKLLAVSPCQELENQMLALFTEDNSLFVVSSDFTKVLMKKDGVGAEGEEDPKDKSKKKTAKKAMKLVWCGEDAVTLFSGRKVHIMTKDGIATKTYSPGTKALLPVQEIDAVKIISNNKCEVLRVLPSYYVNIFKLNSSAKAKDLYEAYEDYEQRQASYENNILTEKKGLQEAVEECIKAASFELDMTFQLRLLKAAHFGKTFLNPLNSTFDHNKFTNTCKLLRVISSMRGENLCRAITMEQFNYLSDVQVVRILIRYQVYHLADEICKFLKYPPKLASQIYVSWACAKIETMDDTEGQPEYHQGRLARDIYDKLKDENTISFAEIARKAVEIGKDFLARKLLEKEKSFAKKLQVLLELKDYLGAWREAVASKDPNLIDMVIFAMHRDENIPEEKVWSLLSRAPLSKRLLVDYLKNFDSKELSRFILSDNDRDARGFYVIKQAYSTKELPSRMSLIKDYGLKSFSDKFNEDVTKEQFEYLSYLVKSNVQEEVPINSHLERLFTEQRYTDADAFRKKHKISDRNYYTIRAKSMINNKKFQELDGLLADKNKKYATIPWFCVIDMLADAGDYGRVERYIGKLSDPREQVSTLINIDSFDRAAEIAYANKLRDELERLYDMPAVDGRTKNMIQNMMSNMKKK